MYYKDLLNINLESMQQDNVEHTSQIPMQPTDVAYNPNGDVIIRDEENLSVAQEAIDNLSNVHGKLIRIRNSMRQNAVNGNLSTVSVEAYNLAVNHVLRNTGLKDLVLSNEAFEHNHDDSLKYSAEGIRETLERVLAKIMELIKGWLGKAEKYTENLVKGITQLQARANAALKVVSAMGAKSPVEKSIKISAAQAAWLRDVNGVVDLSRAGGVMMTTCHTIAFLPKDCISYIYKLKDEIAIWHRDPSSFNEQNPFEGNKFYPRLKDVDPKTLISKGWSISPYLLRYYENNHLKTIGFEEREDQNSDDKDVTLNVGSVGELHSAITSVQSVMDTLLRIESIGKDGNDAVKSFGKTIEDLSNIKTDDEELVDKMRSAAQEAWDSARSFAQFPMTMDGKMLMVAKAVMATVDLMLEAYSPKSEGDDNVKNAAANA